MPSFNAAEVPPTRARRTVRVQALDSSTSVAPALIGAGFTMVALLTSLLAFAAM